MGLNINDINTNEVRNDRITNFEIYYLKNFQNKLLSAMISNGMPARENMEKREKDACLRFLRHIYYRIASEVLQDKIAKIKNDADCKITWDDLELILTMKIESPDYKIMKSFFEKFFNDNHKFNDCNILYNITNTNDAVYPPEYESYRFWSTQDLVGTLLNYLAEDDSDVLLLKNDDDDSMIRIYDDINNC